MAIFQAEFSPKKQQEQRRRKADCVGNKIQTNMNHWAHWKHLSNYNSYAGQGAPFPFSIYVGVYTCVCVRVCW